MRKISAQRNSEELTNMDSQQWVNGGRRQCH